MNQILRISGYIFHPLLMPLFGVLCYYAITPRFIEPERMLANIYAIATQKVIVKTLGSLLYTLEAHSFALK